MKKILLALLMSLLAVGLIACGNSADKDSKKEKDPEQAASTTNDSEENADEGETAAAELPEDKNYDQVIDLLKENDYEVGDLQPAFPEDFGAETAISIEVNGEDMLPLQIYKMPADSDNLKQAHDKGEMTMDFEGQEGQIPVMAIEEYCFFLAEGHPNQQDVYDLLKENFKPAE